MFKKNSCKKLIILSINKKIELIKIKFHQFKQKKITNRRRFNSIIINVKNTKRPTTQKNYPIFVVVSFKRNI